ncbi:hypothetical protein AB0J86_32240 [Micromonospora sp. NPDC049559]|uniref:hypothetical protein n=1 Tax=Micromonospora sp. NPDC049559 TaxID=3155923 RepID=UPI003417C688
MGVILPIAFLLITLAIVVLYAMVGELARRIPDGEPAEDPVRPLTEFQQGTAPTHWPDDLSALGDAPQALILVLSPVCSTCTNVAKELALLAPDKLDIPIGVLVSAAGRNIGEEFAARHSLARYPHLVDEKGAWISGNFGVNISPTGLLMERGALAQAYSFTKATDLIQTVVKAREVKAREGVS